MAEAILVPQVGQDLNAATIVELRVKVGDAVAEGDVVAVVESEKASFEVEAFSSGIVIDLPYREGDVATVLQPLMHLGKAGETVDPAGARKSASNGAKPPSVAVAESAAPTQRSGGLRASPVARWRAAEFGREIASIAGTGPDGAVVLRDVEAALEVAPAAAPSSGAIALRELSAGDGAPVVFLHGFGSDLSAWRPLVGQISLPMPMLALDLPGHGSSAGHDATEFDAIVTAVGRALGARDGPIHLVGHSLGAAVAAALTARGNLDIRSLSLISPVGLGPSINARFVEGFLSAQGDAALATWMRQLVHDPADLTSVLVRATLTAREAPGLVDAQRRVARGVFENGTQLFSVGAYLGSFDGAATVIIGRDDAIAPFEEAEASVPANVALHRLPRVGHLPQIEAPDLVRKLILRTIRAAG